MALILISPSFHDHADIPTKFTVEGANVSPPLKWQGAPAATKSFALVMEDVDAEGGSFAQWLHWQILCGPHFGDKKCAASAR